MDVEPAVIAVAEPVVAAAALLVAAAAEPDELTVTVVVGPVALVIVLATVGLALIALPLAVVVDGVVEAAPVIEVEAGTTGLTLTTSSMRPPPYIDA